MAVGALKQTTQANWRAVRRRHHRNQFLGKLALTLVSMAVVFVFVFPIFYWFRLSITPYRYVFSLPPRLDFPEITTAWWRVILGQASYQDTMREQTGTALAAGVGGGGTLGYAMIQPIANSLFYGLSSTAIVIFVATLAAYALSRFNPRGKQNLVFFIISTRFMPAAAVVLPLTWLYRQLGLNDTYFGVMMAHVVINLPLATLLLKSFFDDIPTDLDEAAMVDGCTRFGAFWRIVIRYVAPGIAAAAVLCMIFSWNEFILTLYLSRLPEMQTVPIRMQSYDTSAGPTEWGLLSAAGTAALIPVFLFILSVQRYLIRGLTLGAVRG
jgi:multiple sugar transport system permease protein